MFAGEVQDALQKQKEKERNTQAKEKRKVTTCRTYGKPMKRHPNGSCTNDASEQTS